MRLVPALDVTDATLGMGRRRKAGWTDRNIRGSQRTMITRDEGGDVGSFLARGAAILLVSPACAFPGEITPQPTPFTP